MRAYGRNPFAVVAGGGIGALAGFVALVWVLGRGDDLGTPFGAVWVVVTTEVTLGVLASLAVLACERRRDAFFVAAALLAALAAEYAWAF